MGPTKNIRTISQEAFEGLVKENMDDLGMDPAEALQEAIETLTLQGVDLSGIVTCIPGSVNDNPVIQSLDRLKEIDSKINYQEHPSTTGSGNKDFEDMADVLDKLHEMCSVQGFGNASIATKNGGLDLLISICSKLPLQSERYLVSVLNAMASLIHDMNVPSTETFRRSGGAKVVMDILHVSNQNIRILNSGFSVVAAAATSNEVLKESFMDLKIDELLMQLLRTKIIYGVKNLFDAIRILLTPDDGRVVASQVYGYARRFAEVGIAVALVDALHEGLSFPNLVSVCVAVNDEICRSIADNGGIDAIFQCIGISSKQHNKVVAKACCSLLSKLAGSDANKSAIVQKGGMDMLIKLSSQFSEDPSILQERLYLLSLYYP